jgi:hypothetical protein
MTPSKNRCGNYEKMMKRARTGASPIGVHLSRCSRAYLSPRQDATRVARRHAVACHPERSEGSDSPGTEILPLRYAQGFGSCAQHDRRGWTVSGALTRRAVALVCLSMVFAFLLPIPLAHAAASGRIYGRLLDGTKKNAPVVGQSVTLQMAQGNNARDVTSIKTDAHGAFAFNGLNTGKTINYAVYTRYQGAQYYTNLIDLGAQPAQQVNLTVYEATTSIADIAIVQATVLLHAPDAQGGVLSISEVFFFKNIGTYTYVGSLDASKGKPNALRFALPPQARNIALAKGFDGYQALQVDKGFATDAALPPGTSQFIFSFELPYKAATYDLGYDVVYPTVQLSLLVPTDVNVNSSALTSKGLITADQRPYRLYQAKDLLAGTAIRAQLQGLPVVQSASGSLNQSNIWLIGGLLLMLAILAVTVFLYRFTRHPARRGAKYHTYPRSKSSGIRAGGSPGRAEDTAGGQEKKSGAPARGQQQALLRELLELDKAYEAGKLKKAAYQERRARTKARLRTLINEEKAAIANTKEM